MQRIKLGLLAVVTTMITACPTVPRDPDIKLDGSVPSTLGDGGTFMGMSSGGVFVGSSSGAVPSSSRAAASSSIASPSSTAGASSSSTPEASSSSPATSSATSTTSGASSAAAVSSSSIAQSSSTITMMAVDAGANGTLGAPCSPEPCNAGLTCVGSDAQNAFCQVSCAPTAADAGCSGLTTCEGFVGLDAGYCEAAAGKGDGCGTLPCLDNLACISVNQTPFTCYDRCDPSSPSCPAAGETCTMLATGGGYCRGALPQADGGARDSGNVGDMCSPEPCNAGNLCVGGNPDTSVCEQACVPGVVDGGTCASGRFCNALSSVDAGYCRLGATLGQACSPPACFPGLTCVSVDQAPALCYEACALDGGRCSQDGAVCQPLQGGGAYCGTP